MNVPPDLRHLAEDVLGAIAMSRFATTDSVMAYGGPRGLTQELLRDWCEAGLLERLLARPDPLRSDEIEYLALTSAGAIALSSATGRQFEGVTKGRLRRSSQKRMHDVWVGEMALAAQSLAADGQLDLLGVEVDDRKLATVVHVAELGKDLERIVLQPDLLVVTKGPMGNEALIIEVDRGTTAPRRMEIRYRGYLAWQREFGPERDFHVKALRVLTLVPNEARLERLHHAALEANDGRRSGFLVFGLLQNYVTALANRWLEPSARTLGGEPGHRTRLLAPRSGTQAN